MAIKVILIEDESGIRKLLRKIIERNEGFEVAGESDNLADAIALFRRTKAEVVFLDIEMNGASGLDCAKIIEDLEPKTKIIFATAHSEYMSDAFELYAFDYLVKPFNVERVNHTLDRIRSFSETMKHDDLDKIVKYERGLDKLLVKGKESISFVDIKDIILVQRENSSTVIYTRQDSFITSAGLGDIESKLDPEQFMRSHKSYLINISQIKKIEPYGRWTYIVNFKDLDKDALMTAEKYEEIKKRFL
ncbi:LytTR family DNA-binding domain-containing protein [Anaerocolumna sp. AGMB13025]|uniref:LytR/AlgR family response regulator transcription factor n=1 Tax=Anaerocolumna sp. AGMB13025 TaxID=3039116 RepID=UPI00241E85A2|nr:LytTR family DNA-binding domain-containing protein [Anaerocolumna sp. AGMB13025]WFR55497.1 LytTR family DNA-binding domain-containing protein [Anaerocolumna sp. AGMB13025]